MGAVTHKTPAGRTGVTAILTSWVRRIPDVICVVGFPRPARQQGDLARGDHQLANRAVKGIRHVEMAGAIRGQGPGISEGLESLG
jgi:hypothetical protein